MKRIIAFLGVVMASCVYGHASHRMHEADILAVFNGCDSPDFRRIAKRISSGMDNELPRRFRAEIGAIPGNHRLLGHCWTFGDAIPRRVLDAIEEKHPGRKSDFIKIWQTFANEIITDVAQTTGLPRKQSGALAALIHDIHLLGDRTPDNTLVDHVLTTDEIRRNMLKSAGTLWGKRSDEAERIGNALKAARARGAEESARAEEMLLALKEQNIGGSTRLLMAASRFRLLATTKGGGENE